jgi:hypothetical protein
LEHIDSATVRKVIEYVEYHERVPAQPIPKPLPTANLQELLSEWDNQFVTALNIDQVLLLILVRAGLVQALRSQHRLTNGGCTGGQLHEHREPAEPHVRANRQPPQGCVCAQPCTLPLPLLLAAAAAIITASIGSP